MILTSFKTMTNLLLISAGENRSVNNFSFKKMHFSFAMQKKLKTLRSLNILTFGLVYICFAYLQKLAE